MQTKPTHTAIAGLALTTSALFFTALPSLQAQEPNAGFFDRWALTIPGGGAGWLEVTKEHGYYDASILWGGGSVVPVDSVVFQDDDTLILTRSRRIERKDSEGKTIRTQRFTNAIVGKLKGDDALELTLVQPDTGRHWH